MSQSVKKLNRAQRVRDDEFYTPYDEVAKAFSDLRLRDKIKNRDIYCPCDDERSAFYRYLKEHFGELKIKSITARSWNPEYHQLFNPKPGKIIEFDGKSETIRDAEGSGSFSDEESFRIAKGKITITNPPFSKIASNKRFFSENEFYVLAPLVCKVYLNHLEAFQINVTSSRHGIDFDRPDGSKKSVFCVWANDLGIRSTKPYDKRKIYSDEEWDSLPECEGYKMIDRVKDAPANRSGKIALPITAIYYEPFNSPEITLRPVGRFFRLGYDWRAGE